MVTLNKYKRLVLLWLSKYLPFKIYLGRNVSTKDNEHGSD